MGKDIIILIMEIFLKEYGAMGKKTDWVKY